MPHFSIFGYYGQGNAGDEAILAALTDGIKQHIPHSSIGVYSANIQETEDTHGVKAYSFFGIDVKSVIKGLLRKSRVTYVKSVVNFFKTDIVIIGGGGLFFDSPETNKWIYGYLNLIHRAKRFGKKVALVGISVGPLHHKESEVAIATAFNRVDLISVRDHSSRELLIKCGVDAARINVIPDLVFTLAPASEERVNDILRDEQFIEDGKKNIVLTPCCYNTKREGWHTQYAAFCTAAVETLDANIWFVPMQRNKSHDDLSAINEIINLLPDHIRLNTFSLKGLYSAREVQGIIGRSDFALAERLHGSIMAINTNTPTLSIAYMPKVAGVLELAKLEDMLICNEDFLSGSFLDKALNFYSPNSQKNLTSKAIQNHARLDAAQNFRFLQTLAGK